MMTVHASSLNSGTIPERVAFVCVVTVIALAPLPFGSTHPFFIATWNMLLGLAALSLSQVQLPRRHQQFLVGMLIVWAAWVALIVVQTVEGSQLVSGFSDEMWSRAARALGSDLRPTISLSRDGPIVAAGPGLANVLAFVCCFALAVRSSNARDLILAMVCCGTAYAIYAVASFLIEPSLVLWRTKEAHVANLTGTFTNRNTAAVFFGLLSILAALKWFDWIKTDRQPFMESLRASLQSPDWKASAVLLSAAINLTAMLMTGSRAGSVISLTVAGSIVLIYFRASIASWKSLITTAAAMVIIALFLLFTLGSGISERFDVQGFSDQGRKAVYQSTGQIALGSPWLGTGLGSFALAFPHYRSFDVTSSGVWNRAHNVPLELAAETGLFAASVIVLLYLTLLSTIAFFAIRRPSSARLAGVSALAIGGAHSLVDFSLQISGFSLYVACLAGVSTSRVITAAAIAAKQGSSSWRVRQR